MTFLTRLWVRFQTSERLRRGQGLMEYALLLVLVGILLIATVLTLGDEIKALYDFIVERLPFFGDSESESEAFITLLFP